MIWSISIKVQRWLFMLWSHHMMSSWATLTSRKSDCPVSIFYVTNNNHTISEHCPGQALYLFTHILEGKDDESCCQGNNRGFLTNHTLLRVWCWLTLDVWTVSEWTVSVRGRNYTVSPTLSCPVGPEGRSGNKPPFSVCLSGQPFWQKCTGAAFIWLSVVRLC